MPNGATTKESILAIPYKVKYTVNFNPEVPFIGIFASETKTFAHKNLRANVYSSFICQKPEATQMLLIWKKNQIVLSLFKVILIFLKGMNY